MIEGYDCGPRPNLKPAYEKERPMPIYEYRCDTCGEVTELLRKMNDADTAAKCSHCGSKKTRRVQSVFAAVSDSVAVKECPASGAPCTKCMNDGHCGLN